MNNKQMELELDRVKYLVKNQEVLWFDVPIVMKEITLSLEELDEFNFKHSVSEFVWR